MRRSLFDLDFSIQRWLIVYFAIPGYAAFLSLTIMHSLTNVHRAQRRSHLSFSLIHFVNIPTAYNFHAARVFAAPAPSASNTPAINALSDLVISIALIANRGSRANAPAASATSALRPSGIITSANTSGEGHVTCVVS